MLQNQGLYILLPDTDREKLEQVWPREVEGEEDFVFGGAAIPQPPQAQSSACHGFGKLLQMLPRQPGLPQIHPVPLHFPELGSVASLALWVLK